MGKFCKICNQSRPNENFSGKGHRQCICKKCQKRPKEEITLIETKDELLNYWEQSNISALNIARLKKLTQFPNEDIQSLAHLTFAVASVKPHKRRRMKWLKQNKPDLYLRVRHYFGEEYFDEYESDEINISDLEHKNDDAEGTMSLESGVGRFTNVTLHPTVTISDASKSDLAAELHEKAHKQCFIANSVNFTVESKPIIKTGS